MRDGVRQGSGDLSHVGRCSFELRNREPLAHRDVSESSLPCRWISFEGGLERPLYGSWACVIQPRTTGPPQ